MRCWKSHGVLVAVQVGQPRQHLLRDARQHALGDAPLLQHAVARLGQPAAPFRMMNDHFSSRMCSRPSLFCEAPA